AFSILPPETLGIRTLADPKVTLRSVRPRTRGPRAAWGASRTPQSKSAGATAARTPNTNYNDCLRELGQAARPISTGELRALQRFHIRPINLVVYEGSLVPCGRDT